MDAKKPYLVVILIQLIYTGLYVISKAAFDEGMSTFVFIFYRQAAASILLLPLAIILERKTAPHLSFSVLVKVFMHSLFGITLSFNVYNIGLKYTSATVSSAVTNSVPVITFCLAVLLRMEAIKLRSLSGMAKLTGIIFCSAGILVIAFFKGPSLNPLNHHQAFGQSTNVTNRSPPHSKETWIKGSFLLIFANTAWSLWLVLQGPLLKEYPSKLLLTTLQCIFSTVQSFLVAMAFERKISRWKLKLDMGLLAVAYSGFVVTGVSFYLQTWCIEKKGPVFLAISTPLALVFTIICSSLFLGEWIHLGSVLGGVLMVGGLYSVLWGKGKESKMLESSEGDGKEQVAKEPSSPSHSV
ncbi:WAT1-related protein At5g64700-like [Typha latifolia]|uniref:WAT1-related protein At5g64700-like n=1 Tax=Typha latifolia TaxID=4733 RepID=UPI003C2C1C51